MQTAYSSPYTIVEMYEFFHIYVLTEHFLATSAIVWS